jgi:hypothetical protein
MTKSSKVFFHGLLKSLSTEIVDVKKSPFLIGNTFRGSDLDLDPQTMTEISELLVVTTELKTAAF